MPEYNLLIEYDGKQHFVEGSGFSKESIHEIIKRDEIKNAWAKSNNYDLLRINYKDTQKIVSIISSKLSLDIQSNEIKYFPGIENEISRRKSRNLNKTPKSTTVSQRIGNIKSYISKYKNTEGKQSKIELLKKELAYLQDLQPNDLELLSRQIKSLTSRISKLRKGTERGNEIENLRNAQLILKAELAEKDQVLSTLPFCL